MTKNERLDLIERELLLYDNEEDKYFQCMSSDSLRKKVILLEEKIEALEKYLSIEMLFPDLIPYYKKKKS